jgi:hypothetical protein
MAIVHSDSLIEGLRGRLGKKLVLRIVRGRTIASVRPRKTTKESTHQRENRSKFREATLYAKKMMLDPKKKAHYLHKSKTLNLPNAYTAAITDYMRKPQIHSIKVKEDTDGSKSVCVYAGKTGFSVASVKVSIVYEGTVLEEGNATNQNNVDGWVFNISSTAPPGSKFLVVVTDWTGNKELMER